MKNKRMGLNFKIQKQERKLTEELKHSENGECFSTKVLGLTYNYSSFVIDIFENILRKFTPRILIAYGITLILSDLFSDVGYILAFVAITVSIFYKMPPSIDTLYIINNNDNKDVVFKKLLEMSKDNGGGFCVFRSSFVIKACAKTELKRNASALSKFIDINDYEFIYQAWPKKEFDKHLKMLSGTWKY